MHVLVLKLSEHPPLLLCSHYTRATKAEHIIQAYNNSELKEFYYVEINLDSGPGSSVGIATDYGLDGPGSNSRADEIFCLSRTALEPTQPPVQ